jgi:hypothetical protein
MFVSFDILFVRNHIFVHVALLLYCLLSLTFFTGRIIQGVTMEYLSHVVFGGEKLDMDYPSQETTCSNFLPNCPSSPCDMFPH